MVAKITFLKEQPKRTVKLFSVTEVHLNYREGMVAIEYQIEGDPSGMSLPITDVEIELT